jgi:predicted nucleic acid-binding protein
VTTVLLDINVVLDVLADREPFARDAGAVLALVEAGEIRGIVAAHTITTLHFLLSKRMGKRKAQRVLTDLMRILQVAAVDEDRLRHALGLGWKDFEDAVQAACAEKAEASYLVTRDKSDFKRSAVAPVTPAELLALI